VRDLTSVSFDGFDSIIHLANIANDPSVDLNPLLSWEVNVLATYQLASRAVRSGVKQIIFASSGSVYGVQDAPNVTEDLELVPISAYNKTKMIAERVLLSFQDYLAVHCIRPATVCGLSPSMRLDVSVNALTIQALEAGRIMIFGGAQVRPNIHIEDIVGVFKHFLLNPALPTGSYNAGFENLSLLEIARLINDMIPAEICITGSNDPRSYRLDSTKLTNTGYRQHRTVRDAIEDIATAFHEKKLVTSSASQRVTALKMLLAEHST
jgi:nucleoside-diphosphate-sugar epimerase